MESFRGKNVVITGGSTGIGLCLARELAARGANLALIARNNEGLGAAQEDLDRHGGRMLTYACDVTDAARLEQCIGEARSAFGGLDGVIANSGYCHPGYFHVPGTTTEQREARFSSDLFGVVYLSCRGGAK